MVEQHDTEAICSDEFIEAINNNVTKECLHIEKKAFRM
jgi:hypothetical protein